MKIERLKERLSAHIALTFQLYNVFTKMSRGYVRNFVKTENPVLKTPDGIYKYLAGKINLQTAIANAKQIARNNKGLPPSKCTPGTAVYEIFEKLKNYLGI